MKPSFNGEGSEDHKKPSKSILDYLLNRKKQPNILESRKLIVVRHGERIDEADAIEWKKICKEEKHKVTRDYVSFYGDPRLTENGILQAKEAAESLQIQYPNYKVDRIYCSKLIRALQTAHQIALKYQVPLYVSKGFSLTAAAVLRNKDFEFISIEEINILCPDIEIIDCDEQDSPHSFNFDHSINPIKEVVNRHERSIIVAHRKSISIIFTTLIYVLMTFVILFR